MSEVSPNLPVRRVLRSFLVDSLLSSPRFQVTVRRPRIEQEIGLQITANSALSYILSRREQGSLLMT